MYRTIELIAVRGEIVLVRCVIQGNIDRQDVVAPNIDVIIKRI